MSWFTIPCRRQENYEEEKHLSEILTRPKPGFVLQCQWRMDAGVPAQDFGFKEKQNEYRCLLPVGCRSSMTSHLRRLHGCGLDEHLQSLFSILKDLAIAIHLGHANGVVHGNLTPDAVDIAQGRGVLLNQGLSPGDQVSYQSAGAPLQEDIYGVRWAAAELFRIDNGSPCPTMMSDVYSFACLMLQILTGKVPYCGTRRPEQVVYLKYLGREPIDAQTPKVADRYVAFMRWCWSSEPENRPTMETVVGFIHNEVEWLGESRC